MGQFANALLISKLLGVLDDFDRALASPCRPMPTTAGSRASSSSSASCATSSRPRA